LKSTFFGLMHCAIQSAIHFGAEFASLRLQALKRSLARRAKSLV
jgi:hypothetical protein